MSRVAQRIHLSTNWLSLWLLVMLWLLNGADALLTRYVIKQGVASESNPLLGFAMRAGFGPALLAKMAIVTLGVVLLWRLRRHRLVPTLMAVLVAVFAGVVTYQLLWIVALTSE